MVKIIDEKLNLMNYNNPYQHKTFITKPETEEEKSRFAGALRRKQLSLILAGKMNPNDATELKALFFNP